MKIGKRLLGLFIIIGIISVLLISILSFFRAQTALEDSAREKLETTLYLKEQQLLRYLSYANSSLQTITDHSITCSASAQNKEELKNAFNEHMNSNIFNELFLVCDGVVNYSTMPDQIGKIKSHEEYYLKGQEGTYNTGIVYDISIQKASLFLSMPVEQGVLVGRVDLDVFSNIMSEQNASVTSEEAYLVNGFHLVITNLKFDTSAAFTKNIHTKGVENCLSQKKGFGDYEDYRGVFVSGNYKWIDTLSVCMLVEIDKEEYLAPILQLRWEIILIGVLTLILASALAIGFANTITKPISELRDIIHSRRTVQTKDLNVFKGNDEVYDLASSFQEMMSDLKSSRQQLEQHTVELEETVAQRTKELQEYIEQLEKFKNLTVGRELKMKSLKEELRKLKKLKTRGGDNQ